VVDARVAAGEILVDGSRLLVGCGDGASALELLEVQMEGKKRMTALEFVNGYRPRTGERVG
jgi:methionyl-tRNA formyltransferase